ncbi:MAG: tetratricopeptide repeat protein [Candidatus Aminicenantes bacterium]|jgi:Tfp pilus assembly protein PilF
MYFPVHFFSQTNSFDKDRKRTIRCRVAVDEECRAQKEWRSVVKRVIADSSKRFEKGFGIEFKLVRIRPWYSDNSHESLFDLLKSLKRDIPQKDCDVVIGVTGQNYEKGAFSGATICYGNYIVLRWVRSEDLMKKTLVHELCHLFGGIDLHQDNSIMNHARAGNGFDEFTSRIIRINKFRRFVPQDFPLPEDRIDEAISHYEWRKSLNRGEHEIHLILALLYIEKGNFDLAVRECQNAIRIYPGLREAYSLLGIAYQKQGTIDLATREYKKILSANGGSPEIWFNLGIFYLEKGLIDEAINEFQKAVKENPSSAEAHANLGLAYLRKGLVGPAQKECEKALRIEAHLAEAMVTLGGAYALDNKLDDAEHFLCRSLTLEPGVAEAHNNLGVVYLKRANYESALDEFSKALKIDPRYSMARLNLGHTYKRRGSMDKAISEYKKTLELRPDLYKAHQCLAEAYLEKRMVTEAFRRCQIAALINPAYKSIFEEIHSYLLRKRDYDLAYEFLKEVERR